MSNYDALASFIVLCVPLVAVVQVLNWWLCPLEGEGADAATDKHTHHAKTP